jgi:RNA-directed DNA polymerase
MESGKGWQPTETGTPQGAVISPLLANIYLNPLDHLMAQQGWEMVRYADDFIILCDSAEQAQAALAQVRQWMEQAGLTLHPTKTRIVNASEPGGFDFLGYHFERGYRWPRKKSLDKLKDALRAKTERKRPDSMGGHHRRRQPQPAGLDEVFPAQPLDGVQTARPMDTPKAAEHPAQTAQTQRTCSRAGSSTLAK